MIVALLALDLILAMVRPHAVGYREAAAWSVFHVVVAVLFGVVFAGQVGWGFGVQFFAGYLVERSLSVDNLFVFVIIMATFAVPREHQQRALTFGIIAALALRAVFIALGATLLSLLSFMFLIFGLILLWTAVRLYRHRDEDPDIQDNALVRSVRRVLPVSDTYAGGRLTSRVGGRRVVTPLFVVFITIGGTDLVFAMDSIPAVFGITDQGYIVFVANAFALLGLRPLFFLVSGLLDRLVYLSSGLALILAFIGVKLILHWAHDINDRVPEISTAWSLGAIAIVLAVTAVASLLKSRREPAARAHAGAVLGVPPAAGANESPRSDRARQDQVRRPPVLHDPGTGPTRWSPRIRPRVLSARRWASATMAGGRRRHDLPGKRTLCRDNDQVAVTGADCEGTGVGLLKDAQDVGDRLRVVWRRPTPADHDAPADVGGRDPDL